MREKKVDEDHCFVLIDNQSNRYQQRNLTLGPKKAMLTGKEESHDQIQHLQISARETQDQHATLGSVGQMRLCSQHAPKVGRYAQERLVITITKGRLKNRLNVCVSLNCNCRTPLRRAVLGLIGCGATRFYLERNLGFAGARPLSNF